MKLISREELAGTRTLTRAEVREVDRRAIEEFGIPGVVLMENAGRGAAEVIRQTCDLARGVAIVCGGGNNGGDGMVIARHLSNWGTAVTVFLAAHPSRLAGDALTQFHIIEKMRVECVPFFSPQEIELRRGDLAQASVIVDAVLGTGFSGEVRAPLDEVIRAINGARRPAKVVAIDLPSGLDCDTGRPSGATVGADLTITFVAPKRGFLAESAQAYLGNLYVVEIGASGGECKNW